MPSHNEYATNLMEEKKRETEVLSVNKTFDKFFAACDS